jgi:hypothetical protein
LGYEKYWAPCTRNTNVCRANKKGEWDAEKKVLGKAPPEGRDKW